MGDHGNSKNNAAYTDQGLRITRNINSISNKTSDLTTVIVAFFRVIRALDLCNPCYPSLIFGKRSNGVRSGT
jgi:hypothetical protein